MRIESIESVGPSGRARRIRFDDGSERTTSAAVVKEAALSVDGSVRDLDAVFDILEPELARVRALALLGYRDRSISELTSKLREDGYPPNVVAEVVDAYIRVGLLDDERYAEQFVQAKSAAGFGRMRILRELTSKKGIDDDVARAAVDEVCGDDDQIERARAALRGAAPRDRKEYERLLRRLVTKGFDFSTAKRALEVEASEIEAPATPFDSEL